LAEAGERSASDVFDHFSTVARPSSEHLRLILGHDPAQKQARGDRVEAPNSVKNTFRRQKVAVLAILSQLS
jgi:hypothetical protein